MEVHKKLVKATARNKEIIAQLEETDFAAGALATTRERLEHITRMLNEEEYRLGKLEKEQERLESKHEDAKGSIRKRLAASLVGGSLEQKYVMKEEDCERLVCKASEAVLRSRTQIKTLSAQIKYMKTEEKRLLAVIDEHESLEAELQTMYKDLFSGPTRGFEEEDELEMTVKVLKKSEKRLRETFNTLNAAWDLVLQAREAMGRCVAELDAAILSSEMDIHGYDWADYAEHSQVAAAANFANKAKLLIGQARDLNTAVVSLHHIQFHTGNFVTDYVFDNLFVDGHNHAMIQKSLRDARRAASELERNSDEVKGALNMAQTQAENEHKRLCEARRALDSLRQRIIEDAGLFAHIELEPKASIQQESIAAPEAPKVEAPVFAAPPIARETNENENAADANPLLV